MRQTGSYIPALRYRRLTPLYDPLLKWVMRETSFKRRLIALANLAAGQRVLDLGCGTATLTLLVKRAQPGAEVVGVDADPQVLEIGRAKAAGAGVQIVLDQAMAQQLPYPDQSLKPPRLKTSTCQTRIISRRCPALGSGPTWPSITRRRG
jgi:SAM-dependent methyltransferase